MPDIWQSLEEHTRAWKDLDRQGLADAVWADYVTARFSGTGDARALQFLYPYLSRADKEQRLLAIEVAGRVMTGRGPRAVEDLDYFTRNSDLFLRDRPAKGDRPAAFPRRAEPEADRRDAAHLAAVGQRAPLWKAAQRPVRRRRPAEAPQGLRQTRDRLPPGRMTCWGLRALSAGPAEPILRCMRSGSPRHISHGRRDEWDPAGVLIPLPPEGRRLDLPAVFGNARPVEVEIGTGKGTFLLARAAARPEVNFLGVEWARSYCEHAADRIRRAGLANVRMVHGDGGELLRTRLEDRSIWRVHIYFPDPWPKRRHHARRLIQPALLEEVRRVLLPGGQLLIVTDHLDYFRHIQAVLARAEGFARVGFPQMADREGEVVGTNFERKFISQGRPFFKAAYMRYR